MSSPGGDPPSGGGPGPPPGGVPPPPGGVPPSRGGLRGRATSQAEKCPFGHANEPLIRGKNPKKPFSGLFSSFEEAIVHSDATVNFLIFAVHYSYIDTIKGKSCFWGFSGPPLRGGSWTPPRGGYPPLRGGTPPPGGVSAEGRPPRRKNALLGTQMSL